MVCIIKSLVAWVILQLVGINLIGFIVRGVLCPPPRVEAPTEELQAILDKEYRKMGTVNMVVTLLSVGGAGVYFVALYYYWNIGLVIAAAVIMGTRVPDLFYEIGTGKKITRKVGPKGAVYFVAWVIDMLSLPLVWYSLCRWNPQW